jgi:zinc protease
MVQARSSIAISMEKKITLWINSLGIENHEVPLVQFQMQIKGGMLLENPTKIGVSNMLSITDKRN